jgi:hypothetical protein
MVLRSVPFVLVPVSIGTLRSRRNRARESLRIDFRPKFVTMLLTPKPLCRLKYNFNRFDFFKIEVENQWFESV